jgi:hypothetical protein
MAQKGIGGRGINILKSSANSWIAEPVDLAIVRDEFLSQPLDRGHPIILPIVARCAHHFLCVPDFAREISAWDLKVPNWTFRTAAAVAASAVATVTAATRNFIVPNWMSGAVLAVTASAVTSVAAATGDLIIPNWALRARAAVAASAIAAATGNLVVHY